MQKGIVRTPREIVIIPKEIVAIKTGTAVIQTVVTFRVTGVGEEGEEVVMTTTAGIETFGLVTTIEGIGIITVNLILNEIESETITGVTIEENDSRRCDRGRGCLEVLSATSTPPTTSLFIFYFFFF